LTKIRLLFFIASFCVFSCATHPALFNNIGTPALKKSINTLIVDSGLEVNMSIKVASLNSGEILYALNSQKRLLPASNNKLYICAAALTKLGSDTIFETAIYQNENNLFLKGGGDPDFTLAQLDSLAQIISSLIESVDTLFVDESLMDTLHYGEGWMWDEGSWWYAAPISALSLNDNCVDFYIQPGELGQSVQVSTNPTTNYIQIDNQSITVNDTVDFQKFKIERDWAGRSNSFTLSGEILDTSSIDTLIRNIYHPPLFAGNVLKEMLAKKGTRIKIVSIGNVTENSKLLVSHKSDSLLQSALNLMTESDNLTAELYVKTLGISDDKPGNWNDGITTVKSFLADSTGIDTSSIRIADGSGVSRYNCSLTCTQAHLKMTFYMSFRGVVLREH